MLKKKYLAGFVGLLLLFMVWYMGQDEAIREMEGFERAAFIRNENNRGPVIRIYAIALEDTLWERMERYGNSLPHTKYGTTKAYFFLKGQQLPENLMLDPPHLGEQFQGYCLAVFQKDNLGSVTFKKYPFQ